MSFKQKAASLFPQAVWTGGSSIHASIARQGELPISFQDSQKMMAAIMQSNLGAYIFRVVEKHCPGMEWLMPMEALESLVRVDLYRLLCGKATVETKKRLQNPSTGNYFHRVTLMEEHSIVGGVRVWLNPYTSEESVFGFRFRLEEQQHEAKKIRAKAEELAKELEPEIVEIKEYVKTTAVELPMVLEDYMPI